MREKNSEIDSNAPDWSGELRSDDFLVRQLKEKLNKPFWRRNFTEWRHRRAIKAMVERLRQLGFE